MFKVLMIAVLVAVALANRGHAGSWQTSEDHTPMVLKDGKEFPRSSYYVTGEVEGPSRAGGTTPIKVDIVCRESILDQLSLRVEIPMEATALAKQIDRFKGKKYRWNISARLTGSNPRPVIVHQQAIFAIGEENPTLRVGIARFGFIAAASMSGNDVRAAVRHLSDPDATLSLIVGHSLKFPRGVWSGRIALGEVAETFKAHIAGNCPSLAKMKGERDEPDEVTKSQRRKVNWYEFESTRFSAAQREAFERRAKGILQGAEALLCTYNGSQTFEYWYQTVPEGVGELIRTSKRKDTSGARLGRMGVNRCPDTPELSNLVRALAWP